MKKTSKKYICEKVKAGIRKVSEELTVQRFL